MCVRNRNSVIGFKGKFVSLLSNTPDTKHVGFAQQEILQFSLDTSWAYPSQFSSDADCPASADPTGLRAWSHSALPTDANCKLWGPQSNFLHIRASQDCPVP